MTCVTNQYFSTCPRLLGLPLFFAALSRSSMDLSHPSHHLPSLWGSQMSGRGSSAQSLSCASAHDSDDEENIPPDDYLMPLTDSKGEQTAPRTTLKAQLVEKDARITELEAANSALSADLLQLRKDHAKLSLAHQTFPTAITTFLRSTEA
ncbi:hypothetical protein B0H17DRAFT_1126977 [Mycena rosella]|uniref:Uncharacterized protein n=1 Tax=Mycena rosella TaxID=1033263 RepID=A0AAD7M6T8_MYCRO|nr:hypothetical protein B0H17DRAFT_1126977 [Mycena rosella]